MLIIQWRPCCFQQVYNKHVDKLQYWGNLIKTGVFELAHNVDRGREPGRIGRRGTGSGRRKGGKWHSQSGGNWEKKRKILQYCVTFHNRNRIKRREPLQKRAGSGSKGCRRREFQTPLSPPTIILAAINFITCKSFSKWIEHTLSGIRSENTCIQMFNVFQLVPKMHSMQSWLQRFC